MNRELTRLVRFFLFNFFLKFYSLIFDLLVIRFYDLFYLLSIGLIRSHDPRRVLNRLTRVDLGYFCFFLIEFFFLILSFNTGLIGK